MNIMFAVPICFRLFVQFVASAISRALPTAGISMAARIAMIATTTSNSTNVNCFFIALLRMIMLI